MGWWGSWGNGASNFNTVVKGGLPEKVMFEQKPEGDLWGMSVPRIETKASKQSPDESEDQWGDNCGQSKWTREEFIGCRGTRMVVEGREVEGDSLALCEMRNHGRILNRAMTWWDIYTCLRILLADRLRMDCKGARAEAGRYVVIQTRNDCGWHQDITGGIEKTWDSGYTLKVELTGFSDTLENLGWVHGFWT